MSDPKGYYARLGVFPADSIETIKRQYRLLAKMLHPDRDGGDAERMRDINEAWNVLSDPEARAAYDNSTRAAAESMLRNFFEQYLDKGSDDDNPVQVIRCSIKRGIAEKRAEIQALHQRLRSLHLRKKAFRHKAHDPLRDQFSALVDSRIKYAEEAIKAGEAFIACAEYCSKLIDDYEYVSSPAEWNNL